ncbi:hypothetical protein Emag_003359 [Eimeria magna]
MAASSGTMASQRPRGGPSPPAGGPSTSFGGPPPSSNIGDPPTAAGPPPLGLDLDAPVRSISVNVQGLQNVRPETVAPELRGFEGVQTVRELLLAVEASQERLAELKIFSVLTSELNCGEGDSDVHVTFRLKELRRRYNLGFNINGRGQAELEAAADIPALAGGSTSLHLSVATAPTEGASRMISATLGAPRLPTFVQRGAPLFSRGLLRIFSSSRDMSAYSSVTTAATGATAELRSRDGAHALIAGYTLRDTAPILQFNRIASAAVMSLPWRSAKHSLKYTYTRNRLDSQQQQTAAADTAAPNEDEVPILLPRSGYAVQTAAEAALPGGDARFLKAELHAFAATSLDFPFLNNNHNNSSSKNNSSSSSSRKNSSSSSRSDSPWVLTGRLGLGALIPSRFASPISLDDKFYFAKMASPLRGFKSYAVGPSAPGDAYFASEVCLAYDFRLPQTASVTVGSSNGSSNGGSNGSSSSNGLRGFAGYHPRWFVFGSLGALSDVFQPLLHQQQRQQQQQQQQQQRGLSALLREWRCSMGVGVCFPLSRGIWAELALALPVRRAVTDQPERFQLGFRVASVDFA